MSKKQIDKDYLIKKLKESITAEKAAGDFYRYIGEIMVPRVIS